MIVAPPLCLADFYVVFCAFFENRVLQFKNDNSLETPCGSKIGSQNCENWSRRAHLVEAVIISLGFPWFSHHCFVAFAIVLFGIYPTYLQNSNWTRKP